MSDIIKELGPTLLTCAGSVITALVACVCSFFYARKSKYDKETSENNLKAENAALQQSNNDLQQAIYTGTYILCPKCGEKIYLKDMKFKLDTEVKENA